MFFLFRVNEIANLIAITWFKKDLRVILDIFPKDQIIPRFSEFDLDQDQDHQKWSRSWSYRSLDQIFQRTGLEGPVLFIGSIILKGN